MHSLRIYIHHKILAFQGLLLILGGSVLYWYTPTIALISLFLCISGAGMMYRLLDNPDPIGGLPRTVIQSSFIVGIMAMIGLGVELYLQFPERFETFWPLFSLTILSSILALYSGSWLLGKLRSRFASYFA